MKFILHHLKEYWIYALLAPLFKMLEAIFELLVPLVVADMIDKGIGASDTQYVFSGAKMLLALAVAGMLFSITAQFFAARAAVLSTGKMRTRLFRHVLDFSDQSLDRVGTSTLITRITSDLNQVQGGINMVLRLFLRSPFVVIGAMIMAGTISLKAMGLFALVIILLGLIVAGMMSKTLPVYSEVQGRLEGLLTLTRENLEGARVIRAFARGKKERASFSERNDALFSASFRAGRLQAALNPLTFVLVNLGVVALLLDSGWAVSEGTLSTGEVVALYNYLSQILVELIKFANLIVQITRAYASAERVQGLLEMEPDERNHSREERPENGTKPAEGEEGTPAVSFKNVRYSYQNGRLALEELSFDVKQGQTLGIVGGTGAGKSTIARLIRHAYDASEGRVELFGRLVSSYTDREISRLVANVPQKSQLFGGTIESNLRLGNKTASDKELVHALQVAQAYDFVAEKGGLSAEVMGGGSNFSGGQKQRLCIARAICRSSRILILDDSTSALDAATERSLISALEQEKSITKIIISQRTSAVRNADKILVMDNGWCVGGGKHEELLKRNDVYREIDEAAK